MEVLAQSKSIKVLNRNFDIEPVWGGAGEKPIGYNVNENGVLFMHVPYGGLSDYQLQGLIYSKITGKPSQVVQKSAFLMKIWASISRKYACRKCKASISHGIVCDLCYGGADHKER